MSQHELPPPARLMNLITGKLVTQALASAVELGFFDAIKHETKSSDEVASATRVNPDRAYRLLRALSVIGVVTELDDRTFQLTAMGMLLRSDVPESLAGMARLMGSSFHTELWFELSHCVKTAEHAVKKRHGKDNPFEFFHSRPDDLAVFQSAMSSISAAVADALVRGYDFSRLPRVADIGGGHGSVLRAILTANPDIEGVLFDLPDVVAGAKQGLGDVAARCQVIAGNFFAEVPAGCDAYLLKHVIHDWSDEDSVKVLKNVAAAMKPAGRVLIVEHVVPPTGVPSFSKLLDLEMLVMTRGGRERTEGEFRELLGRAGLRLERVVPLQAAESVLEAVRA